jgi:hypothetical protein
MIKQTATLGLSMALLATTSLAEEGKVPTGVPHLNHVFVIMMENHGYSQIINNPNAPFINKYATSANIATNYFAIGHPSLTNYLETVGGSNFGVRSDNYPDWHNTACSTNLSTGLVATDSPPSPLICPIAGSGTDAETPALDYTNEVKPPSPPENDIDGVLSIPADKNITGKTIADQLVAQGLTWKSYQESLPPAGADRVNVSDGFFTNNTDFTQFAPVASVSDLVYLYAVKHDPFVYFRNVQEGENPKSSLKNVVGFDGPTGLYADLATGEVPTYSFIAPNQCNDQHGRGNGGNFCLYDPADNGTQAGLNPALLQRGDVTVQRLVTAIKSSRVWKDGRTAIVLLWDEDDYSIAPTVNKVLTVVDTNYGNHGLQSATFYTHFSLLKSIEAGLHLPCLNHACDTDVKVMSDLFSRGDQDADDQ